MDYKLDEERIISYKNIIYVMEEKGLRSLIMQEFHVMPYIGHLGYRKSVTSIKRE